MKFLTKKIFLYVLLLSIVVFIILYNFKITEICGVQDLTLCSVILEQVRLLVFYLLVILAPTLLALPLKQAVFDAWKKFAIFALPLMVVATYYIIDMPTSGFIDVTPALYASILYGGYLLISIAIIGTTWLRSRKEMN